VPPERESLEDLEAGLLLEGIYRHYGFDFRQYARASIRRRLWRRVYAEGLQSFTGLLERVLHDPAAMERLLLDLSINVTSMFRDPTFFAAFRNKVVPVLRTYPFLRIWNAGCSTGEETYSLAIVLREVGLLDRTRIYAPTSTRTCCGPRPTGCSRSRRCRSTPRTTLPRRIPVVLRVLHERVRRGALRPDARRERRLRPAQPRLRPVVQRVPRDRVPQRDDLLRPRAAGARARAVPRQPGAVRSAALGHKESVTHTTFAGRYTTVDELERIYRKVA
jgi:hypothetical protein